MLKLVIGNKNYSSWSMRPWVLLTQFDIPFEEIQVLLDEPTTCESIQSYSPSGRVPVLIDQDLTIWDSLAISEYVAGLYPEQNILPHDHKMRALCRSAAAEMHSGFAALRSECVMNIRRKKPHHELSEAAKQDVQRIESLWQYALTQSGGPFLCGEFSLVDAFFAPVVTRFETYHLPRTAVSQAYITAVLNAKGVSAWIEGAHAESATMPKYDLV